MFLSNYTFMFFIFAIIPQTGARMKFAVTFVIIAAGLMLLGWCCADGGQSVKFMKDADESNDDHFVSKHRTFPL